MENEEENPPSNGGGIVIQQWSSQFDRLLKLWQKQVRASIVAHKNEAVYLKKRHYVIGGLATICGTLATATGLAFARNPISWVSIAQDIVTGFVTGLAAFVTFLGDERKSEKHYESSNRFSALDMLISNILVLPPEYRGEPSEVLSSIRQQFDDIVASSPLLTHKFKTQQENTIKKDGNLNQNKGSSLPNVEVFSSPSSPQGREENISINIGNVPTYSSTNRRIQQQFESERCGIENQNPRFDLITSGLLYEAERLQNYQ